MDIPLDPELEARLHERANREGVTPQELVMRFLLERLPRPIVPISHEEMMRRLNTVAVNTEVSLTDEQLSREQMYD